LQGRRKSSVNLLSLGRKRVWGHLGSYKIKTWGGERGHGLSGKGRGLRKINSTKQHNSTPRGKKAVSKFQKVEKNNWERKSTPAPVSTRKDRPGPRVREMGGKKVAKARKPNNPVRCQKRSDERRSALSGHRAWERGDQKRFSKKLEEGGKREAGKKCLWNINVSWRIDPETNYAWRERCGGGVLRKKLIWESIDILSILGRYPSDQLWVLTKVFRTNKAGRKDSKWGV